MLQNGDHNAAYRNLKPDRNVVLSFSSGASPEGEIVIFVRNAR